MIRKKYIIGSLGIIAVGAATSTSLLYFLPINTKSNLQTKSQNNNIFFYTPNEVEFLNSNKNFTNKLVNILHVMPGIDDELIKQMSNQILWWIYNNYQSDQSLYYFMLNNYRKKSSPNSLRNTRLADINSFFQDAIKQVKNNYFSSNFYEINRVAIDDVFKKTPLKFMINGLLNCFKNNLGLEINHLKSTNWSTDLGNDFFKYIDSQFSFNIILSSPNFLQSFEELSTNFITKLFINQHNFKNTNTAGYLNPKYELNIKQMIKFIFVTVDKKIELTNFVTDNNFSHFNTELGILKTLYSDNIDSFFDDLFTQIHNMDISDFKLIITTFMKPFLNTQDISNDDFMLFVKSIKQIFLLIDEIATKEDNPIWTFILGYILESSNIKDQFISFIDKLIDTTSHWENYKSKSPLLSLEFTKNPIITSWISKLQLLLPKIKKILIVDNIDKYEFIRDKQKYTLLNDDKYHEIKNEWENQDILFERKYLTSPLEGIWDFFSSTILPDFKIDKDVSETHTQLALLNTLIKLGLIEGQKKHENSFDVLNDILSKSKAQFEDVFGSSSKIGKTLKSFLGLFSND